MADSKITNLTEGTSIDNNDYFVFVDTSDTTQAPSGTTKKILKSNVTTGGSERIAQWAGEGFRVNGAASPVFYGADQFPAFLNLDFSTGQSDENLLNVTIQRAVFQAPFNCTLHNFYFFLNESNVEVAIYKCDIDFLNDTLIYFNNNTSATKNDRNITPGTTINEGDFVAIFVKRPDGSPTFIEGHCYIDFKEVV